MSARLAKAGRYSRVRRGVGSSLGDRKDREKRRKWDGKGEREREGRWGMRGRGREGGGERERKGRWGVRGRGRDGGCVRVRGRGRDGGGVRVRGREVVKERRMDDMAVTD